MDTTSQIKRDDERKGTGLLQLVAYGPCDVYHGESACYVEEWYNGLQYQKEPTPGNLARWEASKRTVAWYEHRIRALGGGKGEFRIKDVLPNGAIVVDGTSLSRNRPWISHAADGFFNRKMSLFYKY
jgi:hypothetical protein